MLVDPHINWRGIAEATDGFSGADLQALVYNAHLEVVHSFIVTDAGLPSGERIKDEAPIEYVRLGSSPSSGITSRAEESAIQRRVSIHAQVGQSCLSGVFSCDKSWRPHQ